MKEAKTPQPRSSSESAHAHRPFFSKENPSTPFFSRPAAPVVQMTGAPVIQRTLDWDVDKMAHLAGGKSFRSEEYKNILRAIRTYKEMVEPGPLPDSMKADRLYELQGYAITWLEKHKNDTDPTVERRRQAIEDFAYRSIIREITRLTGEFNKGKSLGVVGKGQISELTGGGDFGARRAVWTGCNGPYRFCLRSRQTRQIWHRDGHCPRPFFPNHSRGEIRNPGFSRYGNQLLPRIRYRRRGIAKAAPRPPNTDAGGLHSE